MRLLIFTLLVLGQALAQVKRAKPHYCDVRDTSFTYTFDLRKLTKDSDYVIRHDSDQLRLQLCEPLRIDCNEEKGYAICLTKGGKEIGIGRKEPEILQEFGKIIFKYIGEKCDDKNDYTVNIKFICDFAVNDGSGMEFAAAGGVDSNECEYNIAWRTDKACPPRKVVNCTVDHGSDHYDLTKLINYSDNYAVPFDDTYYVILNVCHSIFYGPRSCSVDNGICLVENDSPAGKVSKPLGEVKENLRYIDNGNLSLTYTGGAVCAENNRRAPEHIESTIIFTCDLDAVNNLPKYVGGAEECRYTFVWRTAFACSEKDLHQKSLQKVNNDVCTVKDPVTNYVFNLTALMNKEFSVNLFATNEVYKFSICSPLVNSTCGPGTGACRLHNTVSGGKANSKLMWKEDGPYLNYTDGHLCNRNKNKRYTIIEFSCGNRDDYEIDEEKDLCYEVIKISTNLACNKKKSECATPKNEVNLRSLIRQNENYVAKSDRTIFYMNICKPLTKRNNISSCSGAGVCKATVTSDGKVVDAINIGYPDDSPSLTAHSVTLMYRNGSTCEEDSMSKTESRILFSCDPFLSTLSQGQPQFLRYQKCIYFFGWKTNVVCGKVEGIYKNNYITNSLGDHLNLSVLAMDKSPVYLVQNRQKTKEYKISFSSNKKYCNGALICDKDNEINYGTEISVLWDYSHNLIQLSLTEGSKCSDGSLARSSITIFCNEDSNTDEPLFLTEDECNVEFEWYTNKICKSQAELPASALTAANGGAIIGGAIILVVVLLGICYLRDPIRDLITSSTSRSCDRVKYSRVNTVEEVHLLLNTSDPTVIDSDSDDELLDA